MKKLEFEIEVDDNGTAKVRKFKRVVEDTVARHGRLDILVNNAGIPSHKQIYDVSADDQRFVMMKRIGESRNEVILVLNFFEELKQRVGTGND